MIFVGWPPDIDPPTKPTKWHRTEQKDNHDTPVKIYLAEFTYCNDLYYENAVNTKTRAYEPLRDLLIEMGWDVEITIHVITAGLRVPSRNNLVYEAIGIDERSKRWELQNQLPIVAAKHLAIIIAQQRKLRGWKKNMMKSGIG